MVRLAERVAGASPPRFWGGVALVLVAIYLVLIPVPRVHNHLLSSDAGYYYSYMRSLILDRDFDIQNDIEIYNSRMSEDNPRRLTVIYAFSIGPAVLWAPFFLAGHGLVLLLRQAGVAIPTDGYSYLEEGVVSVASILYSVVGLLLIQKVLGKFFSAGISLAATSVVFLASSAVHYAVFEPSMPHTLELFTVALFLWTLLKDESKGLKDWLFAGAAAGLMSIVRWQNSVFLLLGLFEWVRSASEMRERKDLGSTVGKALVFLAGLVLVASLQSLFWKITLGSYLTVPQGGDFLTYGEPHILDVLFSTRHGLFSWTPVALIGVLGLFFWGRRGLAVAFLAVFLLDAYVAGIAGDWWAGASFGMRRLIGAVPLFALGLATLLERLKTDRARKLAAAVAVALVLGNFAFMAQYRLGLIPKEDYLTFDQMVTEKFLLPLRVIEAMRK